MTRDLWRGTWAEFKDPLIAFFFAPLTGGVPAAVYALATAMPGGDRLLWFTVVLGYGLLASYFFTALVFFPLVRLLGRLGYLGLIPVLLAGQVAPLILAKINRWDPALTLALGAAGLAVAGTLRALSRRA
jgi:hypothetical protein